MKAQDNISSDGMLLSLCDKPPIVCNTSLTTPHLADWVAVLKEEVIILIGLLNTGVILVLLTEKTFHLPCATFKGTQMDYDLSVN